MSDSMMWLGLWLGASLALGVLWAIGGLLLTRGGRGPSAPEPARDELVPAPFQGRAGTPAGRRATRRRFRPRARPRARRHARR